MNSNALLDAKTQYQHLLRHRLADVVYDAFLNMYTQAEQLNVGETLVAFQTIVKDVQNWNMRTVEDTVARTETACGPRFITQCLKAIFYLNAKILSGFEDGRCKEIQLCVPPVKDFVYNVFLETARTLYRNPTLLITDQLSSEQIEKNVEAVYTAIFRAIDRVVDKTFPYEDFLRSFDEDPSPPPNPTKDDDDAQDEFANNTNDEDDDDDEDEDEDEANAMRHIPLGSVNPPSSLDGGQGGGDGGGTVVADGSSSSLPDGAKTTTPSASRPAMLYSDAEEEEEDDEDEKE